LFYPLNYEDVSEIGYQESEISYYGGQHEKSRYQEICIRSKGSALPHEGQSRRLFVSGTKLSSLPTRCSLSGDRLASDRT
jgi:hypothetical protein